MTIRRLTFAFLAITIRLVSSQFANLDWLNPFCIFTGDSCYGGLGQKVYKNSQDGRCQTKCVLFPFISILTEGYKCGGCTNQYNIFLNMRNIPTNNEIYFNNAASYWENVIVEGLPDYRVQLPFITNFIRPLPSGCQYPWFIDDLYICATYRVLDGVVTDGPNLLALAAPYIYRQDTTSLPVVGIMNFDKDDAIRLEQRGQLESVIKHEMGHVLGFGSVWRMQGLIGRESEGCPYYGEYANAEYKALTNCDSIPIGTGAERCGHWKDYCLGRELMTGYTNRNSTDEPVSRLTIAAFQDMGYVVDPTKANDFGIDDINPNCTCFDNNDGSSGRLTLEDENEQQQSLSVVPDIVYQYAVNVVNELSLTQKGTSDDVTTRNDDDNGNSQVEFEQKVSVVVEYENEIYGVFVDTTNDSLF